MSKRGRSILVAGAAVASLAVSAAPANASVTFGSDLSRPASAQLETCPPSGPSPCTVVASSYPAANTLPAAAPMDGVIVRVRVKSNSADIGKLRLARFSSAPPSPTGPSATGAGTGDTYTFGNVGQIEEFPARLAVQAGDHLAADGQSSSAYNCGTNNSSVGMSFVYSPILQDNFTGPFSDPDAAGCELLANAVIEADTDGDGFGDETQDECPGSPGAVNGCPQSASSSTVTGVVTDVAGHPVQASWVSVCNQSETFCKIDFPNSAGGYSVAGLPAGSYTVLAYPPNSNFSIGKAGPVAVSGDIGTVFTQDVELGPKPTPPPAGTSISPSRGGSGVPGVPSVYFDEPLTLTTQGCAGGTASYQVRVLGSVVRSGSLTEQPAASGTYAGTISSLSPAHGDGAVKISIDCPGPTSDQVVAFNIYIDPSGVVTNADTGEPIAGASVTLVRSDDPAGPFVAVPDGSDIMSPSNRTNPDTADADGKFAWDVIPGYYMVLAEAPGCDPGETAVLTIPPPALDLEVILNCTPPEITETDPDSPSTDATPKVKGTTGTGSGTVEVFTQDDCQGTAVSGSAADFEGAGIEVTVPENQTTQLSARATDAAGNVSACSSDFQSAFAYTHDNLAPILPSITDADPDSPANNNNPLVKGDAEAGSLVTIYRAADCTTGPPLASGSESVFSSPGISISVADNSTTDLRATATDALGNTSACSAIFTYQEVTPPSDVDGDGVPDASDDCPSQPGPASNAGCPVPQPDPGGGGDPDTTAPEGVITKGPAPKSKSKTATFEFSSNESGSTFECKLDSGTFASCTSPKTYSGLKKGSHTFEVRAKDSAGNVDATPAVQTWTVKKKKKKKK